MNEVSGRVVLKETGAPLPDLLVVVYDADPGAKPEEALGPDAGGDRLGSVLTDADGRFALSFDDAEFRVRNSSEARPDLFLHVLAPDETGRDDGPALLYATASIRQNAGRHEQYLIRVDGDRLLNAGLALPTQLPLKSEPTSGRVRRIKEERERAGAIADAVTAVARDRVDAHRTRFVQFDAQLRTALRERLSAIPASVLHAERLVRDGESPLAKCAEVIRRALRDVVNGDAPAHRVPMRGVISLTEDQVQQLRDRLDADGTVPEDVVTSIAREQSAPEQVTQLTWSDMLPLCRPATPGLGSCLGALFDTPPDAPPPNPNPTSTPGPIELADIPRFVGRLVHALTAPEEALLTGLTPTATLDRVQRSLRDLEFQPSPADTPAFHDFHQLSIAFPHVWQEVLDRDILDLAHATFEAVVELGGNPTRPEHTQADPFDALRIEAGYALRAANITPPLPADDDTVAIGRNDANMLTRERPHVQDHRGDGAPVVPPPIVPPRAPDPVVRLPELLKRLEARLRQRHAFTIFAANARERSVNFGLFNTYRQVWTPLGYQAGQLVKSLPLAPRQTQKLVVTHKVTRKRQQKELENNLRVLKEETSQTSRAEQEIARRASTKTTFSYSNTATGGVEGVASDSSTTAFSLEATRSSDDIKRAFRESVFKAAQEFRNERTTEVNTEITEEHERVETTEISNPNDEIAVTYLFYELQRRYRVHERLHRVMPVVLIAQEVPAPHEIDEAWLVAHDWILKRVILDDSFLPTLDSLSRSAGDATALTQLDANVRQQRQIVAELRDEIAIARRLYDLQNGLVQDAVARRSGGGGLVGGLISGVSHAVEGAVDKVGDLLFGGEPEVNRANQDALRRGDEAAADRLRDLGFRLEREVTALNAITETYAKALQAHHTHLTEIARLKVHVKENILTYLHAIWRHEPPDQRFFRLHNTPVPVLERRRRRFRVDFQNPNAVGGSLPHEQLDRYGGRDAAHYPVETVAEVREDFVYRPLSEVADLDNLLGFKGNYMIFPLRESNALTD